MELSVQIQSFVVSFIYGFLLSYLINLCYTGLFLSKKFFRVPFTFFFCFSVCILYFYFLYLINGGVVHFYFLALVAIGIFVGNLFSRKARKVFQQIKKDVSDSIDKKM